MQSAQAYLEVVSQRGERRLELRRVYRNLRNRELFLLAYGKLYANKGALTPGTNPEDTVDAMSLERIDRMIAELKTGTYRWDPSRRMYIPKGNGKYRPLGIPGWEDKLLQEVIRMVLSAYYEPQFSTMSHGFRPGRGCHTALNAIRRQWAGTKWFIEGDIRQCFDEIDHDKLLSIIGRNIKDERLLKLLRQMLKAGYMDNWRFHRTYSGAPQGGVLSPLLSNIFLNELDRFVEEDLIPEYTRGTSRRNNSAYAHIQSLMAKAQRHQDRAWHKELAKELRTMPSKDVNDPKFRRLKYVRYADDFLLGFIGPRSEAENIKRRIGRFLAEIGLTLSEEKTVITHATKGRARFLGYDIHVARADTRYHKGKRTANGKVMLTVPYDVRQAWVKRYMKRGKPQKRPALLHLSAYDIVMSYQLEFQGLVNYYKLAYNVSTLHQVKGVFQMSLVDTLACKHDRTRRWVYRNFYRRQPNGYKAIEVTVPREGKRPLIARFGGQPIRRDLTAVIQDSKARPMIGTTEIVRRLSADKCELCGSKEGINVHHIRRLKDLQRRYAGKRQPPNWVKQMIALRRKTLVVCKTCHHAIHAGTYDGVKLN